MLNYDLTRRPFIQITSIVKSCTTFIVGILLYITAFSQPAIKTLTTGTVTNLRGLSAVSNQVIWASGSNGKVGRTVNGGISWTWITVPGFEKADFRDIHAFDSSNALIMAIDNPAYILKTIDGGQTWKTVYKRATEGIFLDAMDFKNRQQGICIGDPLPGTKRHFFILRTNDGGDTWTEDPSLIPAQPGEAIFAGSGTNISFINSAKFEFVFVSGGSASNLYLAGQRKKTKVVQTPLQQGNESSGGFSVATDDGSRVYTVGGDYKLNFDSTRTFAIFSEKVAKWTSAQVSPRGFKSCIKVCGKNKLVACGTSGVDISTDGGRTWRNVSLDSYNVCMVKHNNMVVLAGEKGKIALMNAF